MKRILFLIATVLIGMAAMGQVTTINQNVYGSTVRSTMNTNFSNLQDSVDAVAATATAEGVGTLRDSVIINTTQLADSLKLFNVNSPAYGADPTNTTESSEEIQAAIDAAAAETNGGIVYFPPGGRYKITDTITLKSDVHFRATGAFFNMDDYAGAVWYSGGDEELNDVTFTGGEFVSTGFDYTFLKLLKNVSFANEAARVTFRDVFIRNASIAFDAEVENNGWANEITIDNCKIWDSRTFLKTRENDGVSEVDGWNFTNVAVQAGDSTIFAIDTLSGSYHNFSNFRTWDFGSEGPDTQIGIVFGSTSSLNSMEGNMSPDSMVVDLGVENYIRSGTQFYAPIADSLLVGNYVAADKANINKLTLVHNGSSGSTGSPNGDIALKFVTKYQAAGQQIGSNKTARIRIQNESSSNQSATMSFDVHPSASDNSESGYDTPLVLDGSVAGSIIQTLISAALTDNTPSDAEIDAALSSTPSDAGAGATFLILDSDGSALIYRVVSDGSNWQYVALAIAS